jgi:hypothetical protein
MFKNVATPTDLFDTKLYNYEISTRKLREKKLKRGKGN